MKRIFNKVYSSYFCVLNYCSTKSTVTEDMATDKQVRGFKKAAFTKLISKLNRLMAEDSKDDVKDLLVELSNAYNAFEEAHNIVCEHNIDFDDFMKDEQYFLDVGKQYTQCLNDIKPWLNGDGLAAAVQPPSCNHNLGKLLTLPKIDIQPYDGDCMLYSSFISVFKHCVESVLDDDEDRLIHLKRLTTSHAASAILSCNGSSGYKRALSILEQRFGNKHLIAHKIKANLCSPKPALTALELRNLADDAANAAYILTEANLYSELDTQHIISTVIQRVDVSYRLRWRTQAVQYKHDNDNYPKFSVFISFLNIIAEEVNDPVYGADSDVSYAKPSLAINSSAVNARDTGKSQGDIRGKQSNCLLCHSMHPLYACSVFKKKSINQRLAFVAHHKLCCKCFSKRHATLNCPADVVCKKCNLNHSTYIHVDDVNKIIDVNTVNPLQITTNSADTTVANSSADYHESSSDYTFMPTVSVVINKSYKTHALLDSGSSKSFITSDAVKCLGLSGKTVTYRRSTIDTKCMATSTKVVNFILYSLDGSKSLTMSNVFVVEEVPYTYSSCRDLSAYPHLSNIPISPVHLPAKVDLLIGQDNSEALVPLQVLKGNPGDPFAVLTKFGYSLNGVVPGSSPDCVSLAVVSNFVHISIDAKVDAVKDIADVRVCSTLKSLSVSTDCKILDICYGESDLVDGHVDLPIPQEVCHIDNNFPVILSNCYKPLLTSVDKISIMSDCDDTVKTITCKGLADDIHVDVVQDHDPMSSHAPYYPVLNCSSDAYIFLDYDSRLREYSHNDCVFCGPPMNSSLSSEFLYCSSSCYSYDRNALRFLWDVNDSVVPHGLLVHPLSCVFCTCASTCVLHEQSNSILDVVIHNISLHLSMINDCLLSVSFTGEMSNLDIESESVLSFYGFDPTKCFVYDPPMSRLISDITMSLDVDAIVSAHSQFVSKALGISWAMPLKQWLSWLKSFASWINNTYLVLCYTFVFDNG